MHVIIWAIIAVAVGGVILRPFGWPEAVWAVGGAVALVAFGLLPGQLALHGLAEGADVYLFLTGMMLLSELARRERLFDWLAAHVAGLAGGSAPRLFLLIYGMGVVVTVFLSNDATAVVLTPAVAAMAKVVRAKNPLPYLLICAFIANAASFVLPISNPANLVIYGASMPDLLAWLRLYALPSLAAILATYGALYVTQRAALRQEIRRAADPPRLEQGGRLAGFGIVATAVLLLAASAFGWQLGLATFLAGVTTAAIVLAPRQESPWPLMKAISWGVLPLVAGLFVLVAALDDTGVTAQLAGLLRHAAGGVGAMAVGGAMLGLVTNLVNNLPAGLVAGHVVQAAGAPSGMKAAVLLGVDLGPNLSVTGSLATILWLAALRREGVNIGAWPFLKLGAIVMPPALALALAALLLE